MSDVAMAWARTIRTGGSGAKLVLFVLADRADAQGLVPSLTQAEIAEEAELTERQVRRLLTVLSPLIERTKRPGNGLGRQPDILRLRMKEMPAILGAKRRQPDKMSAGNRTSEAGCRQPDKKEIPPTPPKEKTTPSPNVFLTEYTKVPPQKPKSGTGSMVLKALRPRLSEQGNHRSKPAKCETTLKPLIGKYGFQRVLDAALAFYAKPESLKDGGAFQPGLQVIANDGRLEAVLIGEGEGIINGIGWERALEIFAQHGYWDERRGPKPGETGYRGPAPPEPDLFAVRA